MTLSATSGLRASGLRASGLRASGLRPSGLSATRFSATGRLLLVALAALLLSTSAEAQTRTLPGGRRAEARLEAGTASYYAASLHGRRTASGERYDRHALTAAHRTLPFGTRLRVTNQRNGRTVVVRVNDRGPFHRSRVIDLSGAAADALGMRRAGTARITFEILGDDDDGVSQ